MNKKQPELSWGVQRRLEFIEFRLYWEGAVNRADITGQFGVSVPQASKDLSLYQELARENIAYDKSEKRYMAAHSFTPRFISPDPDAYLSRLRSLSEGLTRPQESWVATPPETDIALTPKRDIDVNILRGILQAVRGGKSVEILYQSMSKDRPDPLWRRITPHAFGNDSFRWHVRALCHLDHRFKDFLLPRALGLRSPGEPGASADQDRDWYEYIDIRIAPHPDLTESQKEVVAKDYGFSQGKGVISVRRAMLFYTLRRLGLLGDAEKSDPRRQHIIALNKDDVLTALEQTNRGIDASSVSGTVAEGA